MISVVIAAYNVEQYIDKCIVSLLDQTYKNYEVIVINDCSTDNTGNILKKYEKKINIFNLEKNMGLSVARNKGVEIANGEYVVFVDGDDFVREDYLACLYNQINGKNSICITSFNRNKLKNEKKRKIYYLSKEQALDNILCDNQIGMSAWGKLFPRKVLIDNPFPENRCFEDMFILDSCINSVDNVSYSLDETYFYRKNNLGIMNSGLSDKKIDDMRAVNKMILKKYIYSKHKNAAISRVCINNLILIKRCLTKDAYKLKKEINFIKKNYLILLKSKTNIKFKIAVIMVVLNYKLLMVK